MVASELIGKIRPINASVNHFGRLKIDAAGALLTYPDFDPTLAAENLEIIGLSRDQPSCVVVTHRMLGEISIQVGGMTCALRESVISKGPPIHLICGQFVDRILSTSQ